MAEENHRLLEAVTHCFADPSPVSDLTLLNMNDLLARSEEDQHLKLIRRFIAKTVLFSLAITFDMATEEFLLVHTVSTA